MSVSLQSAINSFFENHKDILSSSYPGLSTKRMQFDLEDLFKSKGIKVALKDRLTTKASETVNLYFNHLLTQAPIEHLTNTSNFYGHDFFVNQNVLIPRSETEILVEKSLELLKPQSKVLDIGCGSGIIGLTIAMESKYDLEITLSDISKDALEVTKKNKFRNEFKINKNTKINFNQGDRLEGINDTFDLIVSNPPYIKEDQDKALVHTQVYNHEPHLALFLKDEEYDAWFDKLFIDVSSKLNPNGVFFMEGHEDHLENLARMGKEYFSKVELIKDYTNRYRFLKANK